MKIITRVCRASTALKTYEQVLRDLIGGKIAKHICSRTCRVDLRGGFAMPDKTQWRCSKTDLILSENQLVYLAFELFICSSELSVVIMHI